MGVQIAKWRGVDGGVGAEFGVWGVSDWGHCFKNKNRLSRHEFVSSKAILANMHT